MIGVEDEGVQFRAWISGPTHGRWKRLEEEHGPRKKTRFALLIRRFPLPWWHVASGCDMDMLTFTPLVF